MVFKKNMPKVQFNEGKIEAYKIEEKTTSYRNS